LLGFGGALALAGFGASLVFDSIGNAAKEMSNLADGSFAALVEGLTMISMMGSPLSEMVEDLENLNTITDNMDGLVISQASGGDRTVLFASENILKGKAENSINVNVKVSMDDMNVNNMNTIKLFLDGKEIAESVAKTINAR